MRRLVLSFLIVMVLLNATGCELISRQAAPSIEAQSESAMAVSAADEGVTTPTASAPEMYVLSLSLPEYVKVNVPLDVTVSLIGMGEISELSFALQLPIMYLYVNDEDTAVEGLQGRLGPFPESVEILMNTVSADNVYHFHATGLGAGDKQNRTIITLSLYPISETETKIPVKFEDVVLLGGEGQPLSFMPQSVLVSITKDGLPPTEAGIESTATVTNAVELPIVAAPSGASPVATPTPAPTAVPEVATPEPTPLPTVTPLPTPLPTAVPTPPPPPPAAGIAAGVYYRIQRGETLYRIAHRYGTTPAAIAAATGIANVTTISGGTLLRIPVQPANGQSLYIVSRGDTFYSIASTFGLSTQALAARNPLIAPHYLQPGQWVILEP